MTALVYDISLPVPQWALLDVDVELPAVGGRRVLNPQIAGIVDLEYGQSGRLFAADASRLLEIDEETGNVTVRGFFTLNGSNRSIFTLAYDRQQARMYAIGSGTSPTGQYGYIYNSLYLVDVSSGALTLIGPMTGMAQNYPPLASAATFNDQGTLWALNNYGVVPPQNPYPNRAQFGQVSLTTGFFNTGPQPDADTFELLGLVGPDAAYVSSRNQIMWNNPLRGFPPDPNDPFPPTGDIYWTSAHPTTRINGIPFPTRDDALSAMLHRPTLTTVAVAYRPAKRLRPIFIVPGIFATFYDPAGGGSFPNWIQQRGVGPQSIQDDPLARTYKNLIATLERRGYVRNESLFVVDYDWRLRQAPEDGTFDGILANPAMTPQWLYTVPTSGTPFSFGVQYLGNSFRDAMTRWELNYPGEAMPDVDIIAHSNGGIVSRSYIQSAAYGGQVVTPAGLRNLPRVNNFIMLGVPNRGAPGSWNRWNDNWWPNDISIRRAYDWFTDNIANRLQSILLGQALRKVRAGMIINGDPGDPPISLATINGAGGPLGGATVNERFIRMYVPALRTLLPTYPFLNGGSINGTSNQNSLLLDLNAGADAGGSATAPSAWISRTNCTTSMAGVNLLTITACEGYIGGVPLQPYLLERVRRIDQTVSHSHLGNPSLAAIPLYLDHRSALGDGTVPLISADPDFFLPNPRYRRFRFSSVPHMKIPSDSLVITEIGRTLFNDQVQVVSNLSGISGSGVRDPYFQIGYNGSLVLDPTSGWIEFENGAAFGWSPFTGPRLPVDSGAIWIGGGDGFGMIFNYPSKPVRLVLNGNLGIAGPYAVDAMFDSGSSHNAMSVEGNLPFGSVLNFPIPETRFCPVDLGSTGGLLGPDGQLNANDFLAYINLFFDENIAADLGSQGGLRGGDGMLDNNDFVVLVTMYFEGCP